MFPIEVDEPSGDRFELALDQFASGLFLVFRGCGFRVREAFIEVRVPASWEPENTTEERARRDFDLASRNASDLTTHSPRFREIAGPRPRRYILVHDYGAGGLEICHIEDGQFTWRPGYPNPSADVSEHGAG